MNADMKVQTMASLDFLTGWNSLATSKTCPELKASWNFILEQSDSIESKGLDELWDFYLESLNECESRKSI